MSCVASRAGLMALAFSASGALAERNLSIYPAAQCAAFWLGYGDYARASTHLAVDPMDETRAAAFRTIAYRLNTAERAEIDAYIDAERPRMASLMEAVIYVSDGPSRDVFERLTKTCEDFGQDQPEIRKLS